MPHATWQGKADSGRCPWTHVQGFLAHVRFPLTCPPIPASDPYPLPSGKRVQVSEEADRADIPWRSASRKPDWEAHGKQRAAKLTPNRGQRSALLHAH